METEKKLQKLKTYKLRGVSYMSLSIGYIFTLLFLGVMMILTLGLFASSGQYYLMFFLMFINGCLMYFIFSTGTKYGQYGLEIIISKLFQKKHLKNDFTTIERKLMNNQIFSKTSEKE